MIEFRADVTQIGTAIDSLEALGLVDKAVAQEFRDAAKQATEFNKAVEGTDKEVKKVTFDMADLAKKMTEIPDEIIEKAALDSVKKADEGTVKLTSKLKTLKNELSILESQGKRNTAEYRSLAMEAGALEDQIGDTAAAIKVLASDTAGIDGLISGVQGLAGGFSLVTGLTALLGDENEDLQKTLLKVNSTMAIMQGLQQLQITLNKDSAFSIVYLGGVQKAWNTYIGISTGLLKAFKIALVATGIGALVVTYLAITAALKSWNEEQERLTANTRRMADINTKAAESYNSMALELQSFVTAIQDENTTNAEKEKILKVVNAQYSDQIGHFNSIEELETSFIERSKAYIEVLGLRSKAQAALNLAEAEQETILKNQAGALEENTTWWDKQILRLQAFAGTYGGVEKTIQKVQDKIDESTASATDNLQFYLDQYAQLTIEAQALVDKFNFEAENSTEKTTKAIRDLWAVMEPISPIVSPDEFTETYIDPMLKAGRFLFASLEEGSEASKEQQIKDLEEIAAKRRQVYDDAVGIAYQSLDLISQANAIQLEGDLALFEQQLNNKQISEAQYEQQVRMAKREAANRDKSIAIFESLINTSSAIVEALPNIPLSIVVGALGLVQTGIIASTPIPGFATGTKKAPAGLKWVGEQGPELIHDSGGYPIITAPESAEISRIFERYNIPTVPNYGSLAKVAASGMAIPAGIDYDRFAIALRKEMEKLPLEQHVFDESGYRKAVIKGNSKTEYLNARYKS